MSTKAVTKSQPSAPTNTRRGNVLQWLLGVASYKLFDSAFDYVLYPAVIYALGPLRGGFVMMALSVLVCLAYLQLYDRIKRDWLGIEFAKAFRSYGGTSRPRRVFAWLLHKSDMLAFLLISLRFDPFITTAYMRRGGYGIMARRDWFIFWGSVLVSNIAWTVACFGGIAGLRRVLGIGN